MPRPAAGVLYRFLNERTVDEEAMILARADQETIVRSGARAVAREQQSPLGVRFGRHRRAYAPDVLRLQRLIGNRHVARSVMQRAPDESGITAWPSEGSTVAEAEAGGRGA